MTRIRSFSLLVAICLGSFMSSLDISIVNVALPAMQASLKTDMQGLQWIVDAYALCLSALILSSGPLSDRYGRKRIWLYGVALFTVGSIICSLAGNLPVLLIGRIVQGIAGAAVIPSALSLLTHAYPTEQPRARAIGIWSSVNSLALVTGPILGGSLVNTPGWQAIFWINIPVGVIALTLGGWSIRESTDPKQAALDPLGQLLSILCLGTLTRGLIAAGEYGWHSTKTQLPLYAAPLLFALFILTETRVTRPLLRPDWFRKIDFASYNLASFVLGFSAYSSVFFVSLFLQQAQGLHAAATGWRMAPEFLAMILASVIFAPLSALLRAQFIIIGGYAFSGAGLLLMTQLHASSDYLTIALYLALLGFGLGLAVPATSALIMRSVEPACSGMASATMNALRQTGMSLGIALLGSLMSIKAIQTLAAALQAKNIAHATAIARCHILRSPPANPALSTDQLVTASQLVNLTHSAFASGFNLAMLWAGLLSIMLSAWLCIILHPRLRRDIH